MCSAVLSQSVAGVCGSAATAAADICGGERWDTIKRVPSAHRGAAVRFAAKRRPSLT